MATKNGFFYLKEIKKYQILEILYNLKQFNFYGYSSTSSGLHLLASRIIALPSAARSRPQQLELLWKISIVQPWRIDEECSYVNLLQLKFFEALASVN